MQINSQSAHALSLFSYTKRTSNENLNAYEVSGPSGNPPTTQAQSERAPATPTTVSSVEQNTLNYINSLLQKEGKDTYTLDEWQNYQTDLRVEHMQKIANDPGYAKEQASLMAESFDLAMIPADVFESYTRRGIKPPGTFALDDPNNPVIQVRNQRKDFHQQKVSEGLSPVEIYMEMLKFNRNLPDSYADGVLDPTNSYVDGHWKSHIGKDIDILAAILNPVDASA